MIAVHALRFAMISLPCWLAFLPLWLWRTAKATARMLGMTAMIAGWIAFMYGGALCMRAWAWLRPKVRAS